MKRLLALALVLLLVLHPTVSLAQDATQPLVEVELAEPEVVPGQPTILRITVLVPSWLPKPVAFPNLEAPDLMVKLLERSTNPTSRDIDGETWSGVSRVYRLSPMVPGQITVPGQTVTVTWAEPGKPDPLITDVSIEPIAIIGVVPDGAEGLDPFLAATSLTLSEEFSTEDRTLTPGDSLTRTVKVDIAGTSPVFVPQLLTSADITGVASYPAEPALTEKADREWLSGTSTESITYVGESGGGGSVPALELSWYNLESGAVEVVRLDGFDLTVDGPPAQDGEPGALSHGETWLIWGALALALVVLAVRFGLPYARRLLALRRNKYQASEPWAFAQVQAALRAQDYADLVQALDQWAHQCKGPDPRTNPDLQAARLELGRVLFGQSKDDPAPLWTELGQAIDRVRKNQRHSISVDVALAPLNPVTRIS
ncbi:MAG: hypothetical protein AAGF71_10925 [Pseudomonadota bacterium]